MGMIDRNIERVIAVAVTLLVAFFTCVFAFSIYALLTGVTELEADRPVTVLVRPGDTIDAYARCLAGGEDKRYVVREIVNANGRDTIVAGDTVVIPANVAANAAKCGMK